MPNNNKKNGNGGGIPAVSLIPGREGSLGLGQNALRSAVERAVGTNILGD